MSRPVAQLRRGLAIAGLILLVALGLLLRGALDASTREQQLRREALAARVFDELEASLTQFVVAEQARPFVDWRRDVVADSSKSTSKSPALVRSPLASLPDRAWVVGYFQIEPDGRFASPMVPERDEPPGDSALADRIALLRSLSEDLAGDFGGPESITEESPVQQPQPQQQQQLPEDLQIQRALDQQSIARQRKNAAPPPNFAPDLDQLSNFVGFDNQLVDTGASTVATDALDLRVTGFVVEARGPVLRLLRTVEIGGQRWVQGLIVDRAGFEAWIEDEVLGTAELAGLVELRWGSGAAEDREAGRWRHQFAAPFEELEVEIELGPVSTLASTGARSILGLGLGLGLALIVVLISVERSLTSLSRRSEERDRFIAAVTHELRTPLTSIRMYSEMLEQGMVEDQDRQRHYHGTIRGEAERLSRLVDQVLTLARFDDGARAGPGALEQAPLATVIEGVSNLLEPQLEARGLRIEVACESAASSARVPRDPLIQILTNLLDNAIKFTPVDGPAIEVSATLRDATLCITVADRGPGVESELLPRIFEVFVRGQAAQDRAVPGTGIGLAVVAAVVSELQGRVRVDNRAGGGLLVETTLTLAGGHRHATNPVITAP